MTTAPLALTIERYRARVGTRMGASDWMLIDQTRIDNFAAATDDRQFIHVDQEAAALTAFGGTIAHGFLSLSLLSAMAADAIPPIAGAAMTLNYGMNAVRFLSPVRLGRRVRGLFDLSDVSERAPGQWLSRFSVEIEIEGSERPALVAEWLTLTIAAPVTAHG